MITSTTVRVTGLAVMISSWSTCGAFADIQINLSVKFILNSDGTRPVMMAGEGGDEIGTAAAFDGAVALANQILASTNRGYQVAVATYVDIQPPAPFGQAADYWFNLEARGNKQLIEAAALADTMTWHWDPSAINVYVNNSRSGQCSFVGDGQAIALGDPIFGLGTVIHELGHIFNLQHTHDGDSDCSGGLNALTDGDGLAETIPDDLCRNRDQLSQGFYGTDFGNLNHAEQHFVNTSWLNVMSYHEEQVLLPVQMDIWTINALIGRRAVWTARAWFVANGGSDDASGINDGAPFATLARALISAGTSVGPVSDRIVIRSGSYSAPSGGVIGTACTLEATGGSVTVH